MANLAFMDIPMPALKRFSKKGSIYDFASLEVGGQGLIDSDVVDAKKAHSRVSSALTAYKKRTSDAGKFTVRLVEIDGQQAVGVWRLA